MKRKSIEGRESAGTFSFYPRGQEEVPPPKINIVYLGDAFDRMENRDRRVRSTCTGSVSRPISTNVCKVSGVRIFKHINTSMTGNIYAGRTYAARDTIRKETFIELLIWIIYYSCWNICDWILYCHYFRKGTSFVMYYEHLNPYFWSVKRLQVPSILGNGISGSFERNLKPNQSFRYVCEMYVQGNTLTSSPRFTRIPKTSRLIFRISAATGA